MAAFVSDSSLDASLNYIKTNGGTVYILSQAVSLWSQIATYALGNKSGVSYTGPADATSGRKVTLNAITGGTVTGTGTATHFAITDGTSEVIACQALNASQAVTNGNTFSLTACEINITDPTA